MRQHRLNLRSLQVFAPDTTFRVGVELLTHCFLDVWFAEIDWKH